jgi:hypothetical protein
MPGGSIFAGRGATLASLNLWRRPAVQRRDSIRSLSVTATHALYPLKVQRKVSNDVPRLAAASSLDPPKSAISAISASEQVISAEIVALPSGVSQAPQLKRE